jgi:hypothetical protein
MTTSYTTSMRRRQNIRLVLFLIILATLPFYCVGFALWGFAPQNNGRTPTPSSTVRATVTPLATRTPGGLFPTTGGFPTSGPLVNTPGQFFPPPVLPTFGTFPTATFVFPATATMAPSLTFFVPPTATFLPAVSDTPIPFPTETPFVVPDTDGDGVPDNLDPCPNDPFPGSGCPPATAPPTADPGATPSETPLPF